MGKNKGIDFLTVSYSSTDYVGHAFGIRSKELEDTYVRLDRELSELLLFLDAEVGKGKYLVFLTADHAASDHPPFLEQAQLQGKFFDTNAIKDSLNTGLSKLFGKNDYVAHIDKTQIYLNTNKAPQKKLLAATVPLLKSLNGIAEVYLPSLHNTRNLEIDSFFRKSYHPKNSGDILLHFNSGWMPTRTQGTTHGSAYNADTHVPMLWYGHNITKGESVQHYAIDQIASTLSLLLNIPLPSAANKQPITEIFDK